MLLIGDKILILFLVLLSIFVWIFLNNISNQNETNIYDPYVKISIDGKTYKEVPLYENQIITIQTDSIYNVIEIKDGQVSIIDANCSNRYCVKHRSIESEKESIVCIPNKVSVEIVNHGKSEIDVVA